MWIAKQSLKGLGFLQKGPKDLSTLERWLFLFCIFFLFFFFIVNWNSDDFSPAKLLIKEKNDSAEFFENETNKQQP